MQNAAYCVVIRKMDLLPEIPVFALPLYILSHQVFVDFLSDFTVFQSESVTPVHSSINSRLYASFVRKVLRLI
jgi:hypothetical protein